MVGCGKEAWQHAHQALKLAWQLKEHEEEAPEQECKVEVLRLRDEPALWRLAKSLPEAFDTMPDVSHDVTQHRDIGRAQIWLKFLE